MPQIDIHVHEVGQPNDGNKGTFIRPHPSQAMSYPYNTELARTADKAGVYHYSVKVTNTGTGES